MNNLGFSNDNLHIGDVRVKGQNETIIIGNENGGDGYILPTEKGTEGQVITMNADNSTSFQDASGGIGNVLLGAGLGDNIPVIYGASAVSLPSNFVGTQRVTFGQLPLGGSIKYCLNGRFNLDIPTAGSYDAAVSIAMKVDVSRANGSLVGFGESEVFNDNIIDQSLPISLPIDFRGYLKVESYITRTASDRIRFTHTAFSKEFPGLDFNCQQWQNTVPGQQSPEEIIIFLPQPDDYIDFRWNIRNFYYTTSTFSINQPSIHWELQNVSDATIPPTLTSDHTQLTNLNLGDAGHTQFPLLIGRDGGQTLSGGITPLHNLVLKSHTAGLPNITIKDLNTQFNKNIDMSGNEIKNVSVIDNSSGNLQIIGQSTTSAVQLDPNGTDGVNITTASKNINVISNNDLLLKSNTSFLDIDSNLIRFISTGVPQGEIDAVGGWTLQNIINMSNNNIISVNDVQTNQVSTNIIDSQLGGDITINKNINMNNNKLELASEVSSLKYTLIGTDIESPITNIIRLNTVGGIAPTFSPSQLDMNNGSIVSIGNFLTTNGSSNIDLPVVVGVPSGAFQVQQGGAYIKQDLQVDGNIYCSNINNLTAVGGVYAGTSDGTLIDNTTEQSVLPTSGVGSLTVPANGFSVGDCFHCVVAGNCFFDKDDTIQIKLKENGSILAQSPVFSLEDAQTGDNAFEIEIDFTVRSIGAIGSIATSFDFTYNKTGLDSKDFRGTRTMDVQPIDTTVSSTLDVTVQFPTNVTPSTLQTRLFRLQKVY